MRHTKHLLLLLAALWIVGCGSQTQKPESTNEANETISVETTADTAAHPDINLMGLEKGVHIVRHSTEADGRIWKNEYVFDRDGMLETFQSWVDDEPLYDWQRGRDSEPATDLIAPETVNDTTREVEYY